MYAIRSYYALSSPFSTWQVAQELLLFEKNIDLPKSSNTVKSYSSLKNLSYFESKGENSFVISKLSIALVIARNNFV